MTPSPALALESTNIPLPRDTPAHHFRTLCCSHCGHDIKVPIYCGDRFCPICSQPRLRRIRRRLSWIAAKIKPRPGYHFKHLTLTIRNRTALDDMVADLTKHFRRLRQRKLWKRHVAGGAFIIEVTGNPGDGHAHIHTLIFADFIPYRQLLKSWTSITSSTGVWIERVSRADLINHLARYLTKPLKPESVCEEINDALSSTRLFQPYGDWQGISATYKEPHHPCPVCGHTSWLPLDIIYSQGFGSAQEAAIRAPPF